MDYIRPALNSFNIAPYFVGALAFAVVFVVLWQRSPHRVEPARLWIAPAIAWFIALVLLVIAVPQTMSQVVALLVLGITGVVAGFLLTLSDRLTLDATNGAASHKLSMLSDAAGALAIAFLADWWSIGRFGMGITMVLLAGLLTGQAAGLWFRIEQLNAPEEG